MGYGICNCVRPPSTGVCGGCGVDFTPRPLAPSSGVPEIHNHYHGLSAEEVRKVVREEIDRAFRHAKISG